ncbi:MAG: hypothetical protein WC208_08250 [Gallionella sp.]|jgi:hypothetical protein
MAWEYLPQVDDRFKVIASYLKGKTKDKVIVDLNCLEARLTKYIDQDFAKYLGNDLQDKFPVLSKAEFKIARDDEFVRSLDRCDILVVAGMGGWEITKEPLESKTATESARFVISTLKPQIIALESVREFEGIISFLEAFTIAGKYNLVLKKYLDLGDDWVMKRAVYIYEKREVPDVTK